MEQFLKMLGVPTTDEAKADKSAQDTPEAGGGDSAAAAPSSAARQALAAKAAQVCVCEPV